MQGESNRLHKHFTYLTLWGWAVFGLGLLMVLGAYVHVLPNTMPMKLFIIFTFLASVVVDMVMAVRKDKK